MTKTLLEIRLLEPVDWRLLRDTRLRALIDSPRAFTAGYRHERRYSDEQWQDRISAATWVVAVERGVGIGIAGLVSGHTGEPKHIESIWVAPTHRNRGVCRSLLARVAEIARDAGLSDLWLWVLEDTCLLGGRTSTQGSCGPVSASSSIPCMIDSSVACASQSEVAPRGHAIGVHSLIPSQSIASRVQATLPVPV